MTPAIPRTIQTGAVIPLGDLANPIRGVACDPRDRRGRETTGEQLQEVPAAALDRIAGAAVVRIEVVLGEMWGEMDVSWHAAVLQRSGATPYDTIFAWLLIVCGVAWAANGSRWPMGCGWDAHL
jgi:hypothetical protein